MDALSQREIREIDGVGTPERQWLAWTALSRTLPLDLSSRSFPGSRLVVVAPHPDDEVLGCGGLIRLHVQRGGHVLVVAVTDGEASHVGSSRWDRASLSAARRAESELGLARLVDRPIAVMRLGLPDGDVRANARSVERSLERVLRPADVVATTWRCDGHPDHEAIGETTAFTCQAIGCRLMEAPVWMWHWAHPADSRVPWGRLRALRLPGDAVAAKVSALAAHVTQLSPRENDEGPVLDLSIQARARRSTEYYFI